MVYQYRSGLLGENTKTLAGIGSKSCNRNSRSWTGALPASGVIAVIAPQRLPSA
jgi:hypothetical protein